MMFGLGKYFPPLALYGKEATKELVILPETSTCPLIIWLILFAFSLEPVWNVLNATDHPFDRWTQTIL